MKSPIGLNDGPFITLLIVVIKVDDQLFKVKLMLLPIFVHVVSHMDDEMSKSLGKIIVSVLGIGLFDGKLIVNLVEIKSLFFKLDGTVKTEGKIFV